MTVTSAVVSFALVAGLLTITPGLDTALVLRSAITRGTKHAFATALGVNTGALVWGVSAAIGISALLSASTLAYAVLRIIGAAYMLWLGARMIWTSLSRRQSDNDDRGASSAAPSTNGWHSWCQGLLTNLLNPKIGVFYLAVLPQFIPENAAPLAMGLLLALVHDVMGMAWFAMIILGTHGIRGWLRRPSVHRTVDRITGTVLIGFGLKLGLATR